MLGKPRLNSIQYYNNSVAVINYSDPIYGKTLIASYLLICGSAQYQFAPVTGFTNHSYVISSFNPAATSCTLRAVDFNNNNGPVTQNTPVSK
jgi:hypothetical protein